MTTAIRGNSTSTFGGQVVIPSPAFSAYQSSAQSISSATWTLIAFDSTEYNVGNMFDTSTYTFQPTVAGYYFINCIFAPYNNTRVICEIRDSTGTSIKRLSDVDGGTTRGLAGSALIYLNGTTDLIRMYGYQSASTGNTSFGSNRTVFQGVLVRAA